MRIVKELPHKECKITIYAWNNRYLMKLEQGYLEQTYKIDEFDVAGDTDLENLMDAEFIHQALERFQDMGRSLYEAKQRLGL